MILFFTSYYSYKVMILKDFHLNCFVQTTVLINKSTSTHKKLIFDTLCKINIPRKFFDASGQTIIDS